MKLEKLEKLIYTNMHICTYSFFFLVRVSVFVLFLKYFEMT